MAQSPGLVRPLGERGLDSESLTSASLPRVSADLLCNSLSTPLLLSFLMRMDRGWQPSCSRAVIEVVVCTKFDYCCQHQTE